MQKVLPILVLFMLSVAACTAPAPGWSAEPVQRRLQDQRKEAAAELFVRACTWEAPGVYRTVIVLTGGDEVSMRLAAMHVSVEMNRNPERYIVASGANNACRVESSISEKEHWHGPNVRWNEAEVETDVLFHIRGCRPTSIRLTFPDQDWFDLR